MPEISLVIPFLNEQENVKKILYGIIKNLIDSKIDYEIIAVDNNSTDKTKDFIKEVSQKYNLVKYVFVSRIGYGNAIRGGLIKAKGKWIGWTDGDLQVSIKDTIRVINETISSNAYYCKAERRMRIDGCLRILSTFCFRIFVSIWLHKPIYDINGKPKFFRKKLFEKIQLSSSGWFIDTELTYHILKMGLGIQDVPIRFYPRKTGKSSVNIKSIHLLFKEIFTFILYKMSHFHRNT